MVPKDAYCQQGEPLTVPGPDGYITNQITPDKGAGSISCPWRLEAAEGQIVNITLINFRDAYNEHGGRYG